MTRGRTADATTDDLLMSSCTRNPSAMTCRAVLSPFLFPFLCLFLFLFLLLFPILSLCTFGPKQASRQAKKNGRRTDRSIGRQLRVLPRVIELTSREALLERPGRADGRVRIAADNHLRRCQERPVFCQWARALRPRPYDSVAIRLLISICHHN